MLGKQYLGDYENILLGYAGLFGQIALEATSRFPEELLQAAQSWLAKQRPWQRQASLVGF